MRILLGIGLALAACGDEKDPSGDDAVDETPDPGPTDPGRPAWSGYRLELLPMELERPMDLDFLADASGRYLVAQADGRLVLVADSSRMVAEATGPVDVVAMVADPGLGSGSDFVYVLTASGGSARLVRVPATVGDDALTLGAPQTILEIDSAGTEGDLAFQDGHLFVSTGTTVLRVVAGSPAEAAPGNPDGVTYLTGFTAAETVVAFNHAIWVGDVGAQMQRIATAEDPGVSTDLLSYPNDDEVLAGDDGEYLGGIDERRVRVGCVQVAGADDPYDGRLHHNLLYTDAAQGWVRARAIEIEGGGEDAYVAHLEGVATMAQAPTGEIFAAVPDAGRIARLRAHQTLTELGEPGDRLSDQGLFEDVAADPLVPADGVLPYEVLWPLYADGHEKDRYLSLPPGELIDSSDDAHWIFPIGTRMVKTFTVTEVREGVERARKVETRILEKRDAGWTPGTFLWNGAETEAYLVDGARRAELQVQVSDAPVTRAPYFLPGVVDCQQCHGSSGEWVLGFSHFQLGDESTAELGDVWTPALAAAPVVTGTPEQVAARGLLHGNCAHCHHPGGVGIDVDFRFDTPEAAMGIVGVAPSHIAPPGYDFIVDPGNPENSSIVWEIENVAMPPVGVTSVNEIGVDVLRAWIAAM